MGKFKIGIIREAKFPPDSRVALTPSQCGFLREKYPTVEIVIQPSHGRCFHDSEYTDQGIALQEDVQDCSVLMGVKEVPYDLLIPGKTYFFFSHTIKKQAHNKKLIRALLEKRIRMIDYETLKDDKGNRVIAFGRWAGIIGTHNAFWTYGQRTDAFNLKRAKDCKDYDELISVYTGFKLPAIKIILTGTGRVAGGALELLRKLNITQVDKESFLSKRYEAPVFLNLDSDDLYDKISDGSYNQDEFYAHADLYKSDFLRYAPFCDLLINAIFWNPAAPRLFEKTDMLRPDFAIRVIADISCDVNGGVPATIRSTTINEPVYGYDVNTESEIAPFIPESIDMMTIDNLPNELPRNASEEFGNQLIHSVWEELFKEGSRMLYEATICLDGKLNEPFRYLSDYAGVD